MPGFTPPSSADYSMCSYFSGASKSENERRIVMNLTNDNFSLTRATHLNDFWLP